MVEEVRKVAMRGAKWRGAFASFIIFGLFGAVVLVIWYGVKLRNEGVIGLDELTSFILYSVFVGRIHRRSGRHLWPRSKSHWRYRKFV